MRGKAIASPLSSEPASRSAAILGSTETPRQRRKYAEVRNRRVSTMGVYHRRSQPPRQPSAAPRSAAPPVPCRAHPRFAWACCALPALPRNAKSPQPPKDAPKMRRSRRIVGKPRRPKVERTSEAKWPQGAAPRSPVLRLEVRPSVSISAAFGFLTAAPYLKCRVRLPKCRAWPGATAALRS